MRKQLRYIKYFGFILCVSMVLTVISDNNSINSTNTRITNTRIGTPHSALDVTANEVTLNGTQIYRGLNTLNITCWGKKFLDTDANAVFIANITLSNGIQFNLSMTKFGENFTALFTPHIFNSTGSTNLAIIVLNSLDIYMNTPTTIATFQILNNLPQLGVQLNTTDVYRGSSLNLHFTPGDYEDPVSNLSWQVELHKSTGNEILVANGTKVFDYVYNFGMAHELGTTFINGTCWDSLGGSSSLYYYFRVVNNGPRFIKVAFEKDGVPITSDFSFYRYNTNMKTPVLTVKVNGSDSENNATLKMTISATDPLTGNNILFPSTSYENFTADASAYGYFLKNITFPSTMNHGLVKMNLYLYDAAGSSAEYTQNFQILNNYPVINNFFVNGKAITERLEVIHGQDLNVTFDCSDVEGQIKYVKIGLLYRETETGNEIWRINYTVQYVDVNTAIIIRGYDLPTGVYTVYAYVIDVDGSEVQYSVPAQVFVKVSEDTTSTMWLMFTVGLIVGLTGGIALMFWQARHSSKKSIQIDTEPDEVSKPSKKSSESKKSAKNDKEDQETEEKIKPKSSSSSSVEEKDTSTKKSTKKVIRKL